MSVFRVLGGLTVGTVLGAVFALLVHPLFLMSDELVREGAWLAWLTALLAHLGALLTGYLSARIAGRHAIVIAVASVWLGATLSSSLSSGYFRLDPSLVFYAGFYPIFALVGGALAERYRRD